MILGDHLSAAGKKPDMSGVDLKLSKLEEFSAGGCALTLRA